MPAKPSMRFDYDQSALVELVIADLRAKGYDPEPNEIKVKITDSKQYYSPLDAGESARIEISFSTRTS
jgi:hypothetical protein